MAYMMRWDPKNKECAERILRDRRDLTEEQKKYLAHVIEEGRRCEEWLRKIELKRLSM
jgi:hypothetical protein